MTTTFREPPCSIEQVTEMLQEFAAEFSSMEALDASFEGWKTWCRSKSLPLTLEGGRRWLERDLVRDQVESFRILTPDPLAGAHQSTYELNSQSEAEYAARGDLHDWTGIDEPDYDHAARCTRCQMGQESRRIVDERARGSGKQPFPSIGLGLLRGRR